MSKATRKETRGFAMVLGYLGLFMILIGIITTIPLFMCFYPGESECWMDFVIPAGINMVLGLLLYFCFLFKRKTTKFVRYEDSQLLFLIWILAIVSGAAPMFIFSVLSVIITAFPPTLKSHQMALESSITL